MWIGMVISDSHLPDTSNDRIKPHPVPAPVPVPDAPRSLRHPHLLRKLPLRRIAVALARAARLRPAGLGAPARKAERDHLRKLGVLVRARGERLGGEHPVRRARAAVRVVRVRLLVLRARRRGRGRGRGVRVRGGARLAALVRAGRALAAGAAGAAVGAVAGGPAVRAGGAADDDDRRGACMGVRVCRGGCHCGPVHTAADTDAHPDAHGLAPVVGREVARGCRGQGGRAEVELVERFRRRI